MRKDREIVWLDRAWAELGQLVREEDRNAARRRCEALAQDRRGEQLVGPLRETRSIRILNRYSVLYMDKPEQGKLVIVGIRLLK